MVERKFFSEIRTGLNKLYGPVELLVHSDAIRVESDVKLSLVCDLR